jgi:hypothetical protein
MCRLRAVCVVLFPCATLAASCAIRHLQCSQTSNGTLFLSFASSPLCERMQFCKEEAMNSISNLKEAQLPFEFDYVVLSICSPVIDNLLKLILSSFNVD